MKERNYIPFEETETPEKTSWAHGNFARLHEIKDVPGKIVKSYKIEDITYSEHPNIATPEAMEGQFRKDDQFFNKYFQDYIPKHDFVITGSKTEKDGPIAKTMELYVVMDEVNQQPSMSEEDKEKFCKEVEEFLIHSCKAFADSITVESDNDPDYPEQIAIGRFPDLKIRHFIYGTTNNNDKPHTYFVDHYPVRVEPYYDFCRHINVLTENLFQLYRYKFDKINNSMEKLEKKIKRLGASTL